MDFSTLNEEQDQLVRRLGELLAEHDSAALREAEQARDQRCADRLRDRRAAGMVPCDELRSRPWRCRRCGYDAGSGEEPATWPLCIAADG